MEPWPAFPSVDELIDALEALDGHPTEDVVAALPHLLQTAARLERDHGDDAQLVAAGLVHDLASAIGAPGSDHARTGAALVRPLLGDRVARLVAGHTEAKRYLVTVEPAYAHQLSPNSSYTLVGQGGAMTAQERADFERLADRPALLALRRADDAAKVPDATTPSPAEWRWLLDRVAADAVGR